VRTAFVAFAGICILAVGAPASGSVRSTNSCDPFRGYGPGIVCGSIWLDAKHAWASPGEPSEIYVTKNGGRKWLGSIFRGGNRNYQVVPTSPKAAVVESGNWGGTSLWTNDGGRFWYATDVFGGACYANCGLYRRIWRAGRGKALFWHDFGDTLYQVRGWPPVGHFACEEWAFGEADPSLPGHPLCEPPPNDAGLSSLPVAQLDHGSFGEMVAVPNGAAAIEHVPGDELAPKVALVRGGSLSLLALPEAGADADSVDNFTIVAPWPRVYVVGWILRQNVPAGWALWRSADGGASWTVQVTDSMTPKRARVARGRARMGRTRTWFPGGFMASARVAGRKVFLIRQLGRSRALLLPGASACRRIEVERLAPGRAELFVEGRRNGALAAIWWSEDAGHSWLRFGRCSA
jgi:hypothetical protein